MLRFVDHVGKTGRIIGDGSSIWQRMRWADIQGLSIPGFPDNYWIAADKCSQIPGIQIFLGFDGEEKHGGKVNLPPCEKLNLNKYLDLLC
jgi:hypothetical protein